ncbi:MAG: DUF885 domain-containing protein [Gemmatimonadaceae bacterium]|nr:DUF885 domain-containing protein [Gemmatimonadaceae bacterium]
MACASATTSSPSAGPSADTRLDALAERYYQEQLPLNPVAATANGDSRYNDRFVAGFQPAIRAQYQATVERTSRELDAVPRAALNDKHRITWDVLHASLGSALEASGFPSQLLPLNQFYSFASGFAQLGAGNGLHPFRTVKDYEDFLARIGGFTDVTDVAIANMRQGIVAGVTTPRVLMERTLPQIEAHVVSDPEKSLFYGPVRNMPASFSPAERARLTIAYTDAIRDRIVPAYRKLHAFVRDEYIPAARTTSGYGSLPDGAAWYAQLARASTTTNLSPDSIHRLGLSEVTRIQREMIKVKEQVGFTGSLKDFFAYLGTEARFRYGSREEMLASYREAKARIDPLTDKLFDFRPKADYEIRIVEPFRERSAAGGSYQTASPDGSRPGIFFLNTYQPNTHTRFGTEDLLLHEGSPGHHFQLSVQRELTGIPSFRRFGGFTAYSEGWGLYAESLGRELGVYTDPYQYYGMLAGELWRAIRLVLDTGIHAKGWTREQAIAYARDNSSNSPESIESEVERFMAIPGQALAYKMGQLKITELRRRAEAQLGPTFDIRKFHRAILENGPLPLDVLETRINEWIAAQKS